MILPLTQAIVVSDPQLPAYKVLAKEVALTENSIDSDVASKVYQASTVLSSLQSAGSPV